MAAPININANLNLNPASINASAKQVQQALGRITGQASEFQKSLDASTARVFAFGATTAVINGVNQAFKSLVSTTINVQAKLTEINSILGAGAAEFNNYRNSIFKVAKETGQSFNTVAQGAAELARQGLGATARISGLGAEQSVKALTAAMNGFTSAGLSAEQIVNKIVAVDTAFAVSAQDLADGFSRAGSTAEDAGVSFEQLLGLITAVEQRTARGGAVIGNAF
jgi:TP901 family phage tail tape measure protein